MKITFGIIVVAVSMVFFYLRVAFLRGRKKRYEREFALKRRRVNGRSKGAALPKTAKGAPPFGVHSWILVGISVLLIIFGLLLYNNMYFLNYQLISDKAFLKALVSNEALWATSWQLWKRGCISAHNSLKSG